MNLWSITRDSPRDNHSTLTPELVEWESEFSVYNPFSGETHLLNFFPGEILRLLIEKPCSLPQLSEQMTALCNEECKEESNETSEDWEQKIVHVLHQFEDLELIEQSSFEQQ